MVAFAMAAATQYDQDDQIAELYYQPLFFLNDALADVCQPSSTCVKNEFLDVVFLLFESHRLNTLRTQVLCTHIMHICHTLATTCSAH